MIESLLGLESGAPLPPVIPSDLVTEAVRLFVDCIPVDEIWYRQANPDVDEAIRRGECTSAKDHFVSSGYFEGRASQPKFAPLVDGEPKSLDTIIQLSEQIPGWTRGIEAEALAARAHALDDDACIVEIGSFLGSGSVLLAGARKLQGSGKVHCVDPFDGSGDDFSVPHYQAILGASVGRTQRRQLPLTSLGLNPRRFKKTNPRD